MHKVDRNCSSSLVYLKLLSSTSVLASIYRDILSNLKWKYNCIETKYEFLSDKVYLNLCLPNVGY